jgi:hypothetical protein
MQNAAISNPNDYKVVSFHNSTEFGFTPEMGCMYDGRPINGKNGSPGIDAGETIILPYHIGHQLAINLAKRVLNTSPAATIDAAGIPTGVAIWSKDRLEEEKNKFIKDLYTEEKPIAQSETDLLMAKVEEYKKMVDMLLEKLPDASKLAAASELVVTPAAPANPDNVDPKAMADSKTYLDKKDVIEELTKRSIKFDARKSKADLEKLLA